MLISSSTPVLTSDSYKSYNLDHLGLIAGLYDELGIGECIDTLIPQDLEQRTLSVGQSVKAMVLNGLGFTQGALYLTPHFFQDKPVELLIGPGIQADDLNDTTLGRSMDSIYQYGATELYSLVSSQAVKKLGLDCRIGHLDSTSFHTDGRYNSEDEEIEDGVIRITKGYSRDHRPDLNQIGLQLICENQAGIPVLMESLSGNSVDKASFNDVINRHIGQLKTDLGCEYLIADSALYTAKNLQDMNHCFWVSRVPETIKLAQDIIAQVAPDLMATPEQKSFRSLGCTYADIPQRWVVIYSPEARYRVTKTLNKNTLKQTTALNKQFKQLCCQNFSCQEDAEKALQTFKKKQTLIDIIVEPVEKIARYSRSGRPGKEQPPDSFDYQIRGRIQSLIQPYVTKLQRKSCFILATNQLDCAQFSSEDLIAIYKDQQKVERGFRFLKDPLFMASNIFLKSSKRIMALMMIMTLCLLLYAALEYRIRQALKQAKQTFPNQKGKAISNPTARWVFQFFSGIHVVCLTADQALVLNLNKHQALLLSLLGERYEKLYSGNG